MRVVAHSFASFIVLVVFCIMSFVFVSLIVIITSLRTVATMVVVSGMHAALIDRRQALAQCGDFIRTHRFHTEAAFDTAGSAAMVRQSGARHTGAIAGKKAAGRHQRHQTPPRLFVCRTSESDVSKLSERDALPIV